MLADGMKMLPRGQVLNFDVCVHWDG